MDKPSIIEQLFPFIWLFLLVYGIYRYRKVKTGEGNLLCVDCHTISSGKTEVKGHILIEIILWLCFLVPGIIYTIWRLSGRAMICPSCKSKNMIPVTSPKAISILEKRNKVENE